MTALIDPEELPFTAAEIFQAARLFLPEIAAGHLAETLRQIAPEDIRSSARRRRLWWSAGIECAESRRSFGVAYPDELLPALASLNPDAELRVRVLVEFDCSALFAGAVRHQQFLAAERAGFIADLDGLRARFRAAIEAGELDAPEGVAEIEERLLPPTPEMLRLAEARCAHKKQEFEDLLSSFRRLREDIAMDDVRDVAGMADANAVDGVDDVDDADPLSSSPAPQ